jgi:hypothetical protein
VRLGSSAKKAQKQKILNDRSHGDRPAAIALTAKRLLHGGPCFCAIKKKEVGSMKKQLLNTLSISVGLATAFL